MDSMPPKELASRIRAVSNHALHREANVPIATLLHIGCLENTDGVPAEYVNRIISALDRTVKPPTSKRVYATRGEVLELYASLGLTPEQLAKLTGARQRTVFQLLDTSIPCTSYARLVNTKAALLDYQMGLIKL